MGGDTAQNVDQESTFASSYDFGIKIPNRIMTGFSLQGFELVGYGACSKNGQQLEAKSTWTLSVKEKVASDQCARSCWNIGCPAFMITRETKNRWACSLFGEVPGFTVSLSNREKSKCFARVQPWPLD